MYDILLNNEISINVSTVFAIALIIGLLLTVVAVISLMNDSVVNEVIGISSFIGIILCVIIGFFCLFIDIFLEVDKNDFKKIYGQEELIETYELLSNDKVSKPIEHQEGNKYKFAIKNDKGFYFKEFSLYNLTLNVDSDVQSLYNKENDNLKEATIEFYQTKNSYKLDVSPFKGFLIGLFIEGDVEDYSYSGAEDTINVNILNINPEDYKVLEK